MVCRCLVFRHFIDIWFVISLLRRGVVRCLVTTFYPCEGDSDRKDKFDHLKISNYMEVGMLKNWSCRYSSRYFIKFVGFMPVYYAINLNIALSCMVFNYLYLRFIDLLQF